MRLLVLSLLLAPTAHASCSSAPECLAQLRLPKAGAVTMAEVGAAVAPVVLAMGALATIAREQHRPKETPDGVVIKEDEDGRPRASLELVPAPRDRYYNPNPPSDRKRPSGAFRFNDTATNVAIAVGGAALLGSIVAGIAKSVHH